MRSRSASDAAALTASKSPSIKSPASKSLGAVSPHLPVLNGKAAQSGRDRSRRGSLPGRALSMTMAVQRYENGDYEEESKIHEELNFFGPNCEVDADMIYDLCNEMKTPRGIPRFALRMLKKLLSFVSSIVRYFSLRRNPRAFAGLMIYAVFLLGTAANFRHSLVYYPDLSEVIAQEEAVASWSKSEVMALGFDVESIDETADELPAKRICVVMTATERKFPFLYASAATILRSLVKSGEDGIFVVNDVGLPRSRKKPAVDLLELSNIQVLRKPGCNPGRGTGNRCPAKIKAKLDLIESLKVCLSLTSAQYITVVEDDVFASDKFIQRQLHVADALHDNKQPWTLLRLFRTDIDDGFTLSLKSIVEIMSCSAVVSIFWLGLLGKPFWKIRKWSSAMRNLFYSRLLVIGFLCAASFLVFGRQNTIAPLFLRSGISEAPSEVGNNGIMFPRGSAEALVAFMQSNHRSAAADEVINSFCTSRHNVAPCLLLRPNLLEHTGRFSAISSRRTLRETSNPRSHFATYLRTSEWFVPDDAEIHSGNLARHAVVMADKDSPVFTSSMENVHEVIGRDQNRQSTLPIRFILTSIALINIAAFYEHFYVPTPEEVRRRLFGHARATSQERVAQSRSRIVSGQV